MFKKKNKNNEAVSSLDGEISIMLLNAASNDSDKKEWSLCPKGVIEKIKFNSENYKFCVGSEEGVEQYSKKLISDLVLLASYIKEFEVEKAYYKKDETSIYVLELFGTNKNNISIEEIPLDGMTPSDAADAHFDGESNTHIEESIEEIRKAYTKENYRSLVVLILLVLVLFGMAYYLFFGEEQKVIKKAPPKPEIIPLTVDERAHIMRAVSLKIIDEMESELTKYKETPELIDLRRIISFNLSRKEDIPPVEPYLVDDTRWEFPPGPRRGAVKYVLSMTTEQSFPSIGYKFSHQSYFAKDEDIELMLDENYLQQNPSDLDSLTFNEACLVGALNIAEDTTPRIRDDRSIELNIKDIKPNVILSRLKPVIEQCPLIITTVNQKNEVFDFDIVLYRAEKKE